jgi:hypothetical protein
MSDSPRFGFDDEVSYRADKPQRSWGKSCLVGCLWTLAVLAVVGVVLGFWIARRWRDWVSNFGAQAIKQSIQAADLPPAEKDELGVEIDRIADAFRQGKLSGEQVGAIVQMILDSPLAGAIAVAVVETKYFDASGLAEEEKVEGRRTLQRFARGAIDGKIPDPQRDAVLDHLGDRDESGNWQMHDRVSDEDLRAFLAAAKAEADAAAIEEQPAEVDLSDELKRIVDKALAEPVAAP